MAKTYQETKEGKKAFVEEQLAPLVCSFRSGYATAEYIFDEDTKQEFVILRNAQGWECRKIEVTADSIRALLQDVFNNFG